MAIVFSFGSTLGGVKLFVRALLDDYGQSGLMDDAPGVEALILHEVDQTARAYRCHWGTESLALIAGQKMYTLGRVFDINRALVTDSAGKQTRVVPMTEAQLDRRDDTRFANSVQMIVAWRDVPATDAPDVYIPHDGDTVQLVPPPSTNRGDGLEFRGWATPPANWSADGDSAPTPLDGKYTPVVGHRVALALVRRAGGDTAPAEAGLAAALATAGVKAGENSVFTVVGNDGAN